jgi:hypothetical protein
LAKGLKTLPDRPRTRGWKRLSTSASDMGFGDDEIVD